MPRDTTPQNITIDGFFDRDHLHEQIIQPNRVFRVTYYFVDYWLPLLKPSTAWLVVALQQSYWQKEKGKITHNRLGKQSGLKRHQVMNLLNDAEQHIHNSAPNSSTAAYYMSWFLRQIDRTGQAKQGKRANVYTVLLNTPLTPRHQAGLHKILTDISTGHQDIEERLEAIQALCQTPRSELLDRLQGTASQLPLPPKARTIEQLVMTACGTSDNHPLRKPIQAAATRLADHLLQANRAYLGHQYFREKWISLLGSNIAWLLTVIRRHSYVTPDDAKIRNKFTYSRRILADMLGLSERTLRRNIADKENDLKQFIPDLTVNKTAFTGHVSVNADPLIADDAKLLAHKPTGIGQNSTTLPTGIGQNSTTASTDVGQNSTTPLTGIGQNSTTPSTDVGQNSTTPLTDIGQNSTTLPTGIGQNSTTASTGIGQNSTTPSTDVGQDSTTSPTNIGQNSTAESFKALNTSTSKQKQHHHQQAPDGDDDVFPGVGQKATTATIKSLLSGIGIFEPMLSKVMGKNHVTFDYASAWRDWFENQGDYGVGWVIQQMSSGLTPPTIPKKEPPNAHLADILLNMQRRAEEQKEIPLIDKQWHQVLEIFRPTLARNIFRQLTDHSSVSSISDDDGEPIVLIHAGNDFAQFWLQRLEGNISQYWKQMHGQRVSVQIKELTHDK